MSEADTIALAGRLGYQYTQFPNPRRPLTEYILDMRPFTVIGPFVIIRELILDAQGQSIYTKRGRQRFTRKIRRLPDL